MGGLFDRGHGGTDEGGPVRRVGGISCIVREQLVCCRNGCPNHTDCFDATDLGGLEEDSFEPSLVGATGMSCRVWVR